MFLGHHDWHHQRRVHKFLAASLRLIETLDFSFFHHDVSTYEMHAAGNAARKIVVRRRLFFLLMTLEVITEIDFLQQRDTKPLLRVNNSITAGSTTGVHTTSINMST